MVELNVNVRESQIMELVKEQVKAGRALRDATYSENAAEKELGRVRNAYERSREVLTEAQTHFDETTNKLEGFLELGGPAQSNMPNVRGIPQLDALDGTGVMPASEVNVAGEQPKS